MIRDILEGETQIFGCGNFVRIHYFPGIITISGNVCRISQVNVYVVKSPDIKGISSYCKVDTWLKAGRHHIFQLYESSADNLD